MTDTGFYQALDQLAQELLTDFGAPATLRVITKGKPNEQGVVQATSADTPGLAVRTENKEVLAMFERTATAALVVKFPVADVPTEARVLHGGATWKVQEVRPVNPLGTSMLVAFVSCTTP